MERLDQATIQLFSDPDGTDAISAAIPLRKWITFEVDVDSATYVLYDGRWYRVDSDYGSLVQARISKLFVDSAEWSLPIWAAGENEADYNVRLAAHLGGVCLDRQLIRTSAHPRGIEPCDVYLPDGTLVHVKKTESSAPASHLLGQALVSALAIRNDAETRTKLRASITAAGGDPGNLLRTPKRVLLVLARPGGTPISSDTLFTFTKVTVVRAAGQLAALGINVDVASI